MPDETVIPGATKTTLPDVTAAPEPEEAQKNVREHRNLEQSDPTVSNWNKPAAPVETSEAQDAVGAGTRPVEKTVADTNTSITTPLPHAAS